MKKILILIVFNSALLFSDTLAWTGDRFFTNGLQGYALSEPASLLLLGAALFSFSLFWKKVNRKAIDS